MTESISLKGMVIRGFEEKQRSKNNETNKWFLAMLKNDEGDNITIRTDKRILLKLIAGETVDVIISQSQTRLGELLESKPHGEAGEVLEYKKGQWIPSTEENAPPKTNED
jgi:hypothetical protein